MTALGLQVSDVTLLPAWPLVKAVGTMVPLAFVALLSIMMAKPLLRRRDMESLVCVAILGFCWGFVVVG